MSVFTKAVRSQRKLRVAIDGPSGSGKTFTALRLAFSLVRAGLGSRIAVIDTEHNSTSTYADEAPDGYQWEFDAFSLKQFAPDQFVAAINAAVKEGFDIVVIDSLSHAWIGEGGALDIVDSKEGNKFTAWKDVTPMHRRMVDTIIRCPAHVIATMRSKTEWVIEDQTNKEGKTVKVPRKIGVAPVQREGMEYEFDLYGSIDWSHQFKISKSRCSVMQDQTAMKPGPAFWQPLFDWLKSAKPSPQPSGNGEQKSEQPLAEATKDLFEKDLIAAESDDALKSVGGRIKAAFESKQIDDAARGSLLELFKKRKEALSLATSKS